jgi:hypothetical protein
VAKPQIVLLGKALAHFSTVFFSIKVYLMLPEQPTWHSECNFNAIVAGRIHLY